MVNAANNHYDIYSNNFDKTLSTQKLLLSNTTSSLNRNPIQSTTPVWDSLSYDRVNTFSSSDTPELLRGKEDMAPDYLFNTY